MKTFFLALVLTLTTEFREAALDASNAIERASHLHLEDRRLFVEAKTEYEKLIQKSDRLRKTKEDNRIQLRLIMYSSQVEKCDTIARTTYSKQFAFCLEDESRERRQLNEALNQ